VDYTAGSTWGGPSEQSRKAEGHTPHNHGHSRQLCVPTQGWREEHLDQVCFNTWRAGRVRRANPREEKALCMGFPQRVFQVEGLGGGEAHRMIGNAIDLNVLTLLVTLMTYRHENRVSDLPEQEEDVEETSLADEGTGENLEEEWVDHALLLEGEGGKACWRRERYEATTGTGRETVPRDKQAAPSTRRWCA